MFLILLALVLSAILYRIPRGGGLGSGKSTEGALIWAGFTALSFVWIFGLPWWCIPLLVALLMLGEAPGWSKWWPNAPGANIWRLSGRGLLLLNPLMGPIYFGAFRHREQLPRYGRFLDGWTAYAELLSGFVTACSYALLACLVALWFF